QQIRQFYQETELYIWELTKWHASEAYNSYKDQIRRAILEFPPTTHPRVLDFGSGVATASLMFAEAGYQVTLADVPGKTLSFAQHRFKRRGLQCSTIEITEDLPNIPGTFDVIVSFDVLEHIPNADQVLNGLVCSLRTSGAALIVAAFHDHGDHPQHLQSNINRFNKIPWGFALAGSGLKA